MLAINITISKLICIPKPRILYSQKDDNDVGNLYGMTQSKGIQCHVYMCGRVCGRALCMFAFVCADVLPLFRYPGHASHEFYAYFILPLFSYPGHALHDNL